MAAAAAYPTTPVLDLDVGCLHPVHSHANTAQVSAITHRPPPLPWPAQPQPLVLRPTPLVLLVWAANAATQVLHARPAANVSARAYRPQQPQLQQQPQASCQHLQAQAPCPLQLIQLTVPPRPHYSQPALSPTPYVRPATTSAQHTSGQDAAKSGATARPQIVPRPQPSAQSLAPV